MRRLSPSLVLVILQAGLLIQGTAGTGQPQSETAEPGQSKVLWVFEITYRTQPQQVYAGETIVLMLEMKTTAGGTVRMDDGVLIVADSSGKYELIHGWRSSLISHASINFTFSRPGQYTVRLVGHFWDLDFPIRHGAAVFEFTQKVQSRWQNGWLDYLPWLGLGAAAIFSGLLAKRARAPKPASIMDKEEREMHAKPLGKGKVRPKNCQMTCSAETYSLSKSERLHMGKA